MFIDHCLVLAVFEDAKLEAAREIGLMRELWDLLPPDEAKIAEAKWRIEQNEIRKQRAHDLAVAERSRSLNFWGNR